MLARFYSQMELRLVAECVGGFETRRQRRQRGNDFFSHLRKRLGINRLRHCHDSIEPLPMRDTVCAEDVGGNEFCKLDTEPTSNCAMDNSIL